METTLADTDFSNFSSLIFKVNHLFIEKTTLHISFVKTDEELDGIDIDNIRKSEDLPRLVFINEECGKSKLVVDGGELTRNTNKKKKPDVSQGYRYPLCENAIGESVYSIVKRNIVNQSGKHYSFCG